jgi:protein ImuB
VSSPAERTLCVWCPDWPVVVARRAVPARAGQPVAVVEPGAHGTLVRAASSEARRDGVRRGLRRREAEARCPGLVVLDADPAVEARAFEVVARAVEAVTPGLVLEQPGVLTFPTRGPARYFGGDAGLGRRVGAALTEIGLAEARVGVADGRFAARLAARRARPGDAHVVAPGDTPSFLASWPVDVLDDAEGLPELLTRLGLERLGDFAALPGSAVLARFGPAGVRAHRLARGLGEHAVRPAPAPPELVETWEFDPPATRVEEVAFVAKGLADRLLDRLAARGLTCTQVVVDAETEHGERLSRCWRHEGALTATGLATRVRWQLDGWLTRGGEAAEDDATGGLTLVRLVPDQVVAATGRQLGFWGGDAAAGDRADRALARLQAMVGPSAVVTVLPRGGRIPSERTGWVPWGEARDGDPGPEAPTWPGAVPGPPPARVFESRLPVALLDADGEPVLVSGRGEASAAPARLVGDPLGVAEVVAWAGPWPQDVCWWDRVSRRRRALWQVVARTEVTDVACLVVVEGGRAGIEAIYD